jgi:hypothetical protein
VSAHHSGVDHPEAQRPPQLHLTAAQHESFRARGFLVLRRWVPESFLTAVLSVLEDVVDDDIRRWLASGILRDPLVDEPFQLRYHRSWQAAGRPAGSGTIPDERFFARAGAELLNQDWLLALASDVLGVDRVRCLSSSFFRSRFHDDPSTALPWHQDAPCVGPISGVDFVTAWIPLVDVTEGSSGIEISPIGPDQRAFPTSYSERFDYVCMRDEDSEHLLDVQPVYMDRGDLLLMSPYLPHRTIEGTSECTRWSIDLRFGT